MIPKKISPKKLKGISNITILLVAMVFGFLCFEIYFPRNIFSHETITYTVTKGTHDEEIADALQKIGVIRSSLFFQLYEISSFKHSHLQAGKYNFSPRMSVYDVVQKMVTGDVVKNEITILEGWSADDVSDYLNKKGICTKDEFADLIKIDYSSSFDFLADKPKSANLEGYLFPDTYEIADGDSCQGVIEIMLSNFGKKLTPALRTEITKQKKSIFDVITMASMIEKEVRSISDKKIVSGILWKRIAIGMPLQLDSTVNYITNKNDPSVSIKATKIDSPYNTYKYAGLPKGPISNPGINSITSAIYPTKTDYLYWLSDGSTHFSKTLDEHNTAKALYLNN